MWRALHHPNVLPLLGVTMAEDQLVIATEWMPKGDIMEAIKADMNLNRLELVCLLSNIFIFILMLTID